MTVLQLRGPMAFCVLQWCHPMLASTKRTSCCTQMITLYGARKWIQARAASIWCSCSKLGYVGVSISTDTRCFFIVKCQLSIQCLEVPAPSNSRHFSATMCFLSWHKVEPQLGIASTNLLLEPRTNLQLTLGSVTRFLHLVQHV